MTNPTTPNTSDERLLLPREISIKLSSRDDGGLRICSDDLPGLILSGTDIPAMLRDLPKAMAKLIERGGLRTQSPAPQPADDGEWELRAHCPRCGMSPQMHDLPEGSLLDRLEKQLRRFTETKGSYFVFDVQTILEAVEALRRFHALSPAQDTAGLRCAAREQKQYALGVLAGLRRAEYPKACEELRHRAEKMIAEANEVIGVSPLQSDMVPTLQPILDDLNEALALSPTEGQ